MSLADETDIRPFALVQHSNGRVGIVEKVSRDLDGLLRATVFVDPGDRVWSSTAWYCADVEVVGPPTRGWTHGHPGCRPSLLPEEPWPTPREWEALRAGAAKRRQR